jgi:hypothetical protein
MGNRCLTFGLVTLVLICPALGWAQSQQSCAASANPPKLPVTRASGRFGSSPTPIRVHQTAGLADTWRPTRREVASVPSGTVVDVLEDLIVVDAPDIVRVTQSISEMNVKEGDTLLRFARLDDGTADFWVDGCWYKDINADFIVGPDGGGCGGSDCSARVTKMGKQSWWVHIKLPNGKTGWTQSLNLDVPEGK